MTREDVKGILPEITDEQLNSLMKRHGDTVVKLNEDITTLKGELATAQSTIENLQKAGDDTEALKKELEDYRKAETDRKNAEAEAEKEKAINDRFNALVGETKFINDFTKSGILSEFKEAIGKKENEGKGDKDIYSALIKDRADIFVSKNTLSLPDVNQDANNDMDGVTRAFLAKNPEIKL